MNKGELVESIASAANISKTDAESALNAFIDTVQNTIAGGDKVTLPGFGTFAGWCLGAGAGMATSALLRRRADTAPVPSPMH